MTDFVSLTPAALGGGGIDVTASADAFTDDDVGRLLRVKLQAPRRAPASPYGKGSVVYADDRGVARLYRCIRDGTTATASMAGTTPDYDLNTPILENEDVNDGTARWNYIGRGQSAWGFGHITAVASSTVATVEVAANGEFASTTESLVWQLGEWGGGRGWPRAVALYNQRSWWLGDAANPQTAWSSETGDFEAMSPTEPDGAVLDTNAITETIDDDELQTILWALNQGQGIAIGTPSGEFLLGPALTTQVLGPSNVLIARKGKRGSIDEAPALRAGDALLFVQRGGRIQRELVLDQYTAHGTTADISVLSEHITESGVVDSALQDAPLGIIWHVRNDGLLCAITYDADQKIRAWTRHQLAGDAVVESICVVPGPDGASDDVYLSVYRETEFDITRWIEVIRAPFRAESDGVNGGFFVDAGLTYNGAPATVISGLDHLEGRAVSVRGDNVDLNDPAIGGPYVVTGGAITLPFACSVVHVGLGFTSRITTLPSEAGAPPGQTAQGKAKRIHEVVLRLLESQGGSFGRQGFGTLDPIRETVNDGSLFTGDSREVFPAGFDRLGQITIEHTGNGPLTVLAIIQELQTDG